MLARAGNCGLQALDLESDCVLVMDDLVRDTNAEDLHNHDHGVNCHRIHSLCMAPAFADQRVAGCADPLHEHVNADEREQDHARQHLAHDAILGELRLQGET